jgi:hypothetical protein
MVRCLFMQDHEADAAAITDRLNELSNKAAVLASGLIRIGIDRPSMVGLVNLAWELSSEIADISRRLSPAEPQAASGPFCPAGSDSDVGC